jgi:hypothetical protein
MNDNNILYELIKNQRNNISNKKLSYNDIKKISENLNESIFNNNTCSLWYGGNLNNNYINFYFNGKKVPLQRLLFINYIDDLNNNEYIKYKCSNKGICCNINHLYKNNKNNNNNNNEINNDNNNNKIITNICVGFN